MPARVDLTLRYPDTARDAAVVLVEQMWTAITDGHLVAPRACHRPGLQSWLSAAALCLGSIDRQKEHKRMFKVTANPTFLRSVSVEVPVDGGYSSETMKVTYRALPTSEAAKHDLNTAQGSTDFLRAAVVRIDDLVDEAGAALSYNDALRDQLFDMPYVRTALAREYFAAVAAAKRGN